MFFMIYLFGFFYDLFFRIFGIYLLGFYLGGYKEHLMLLFLVDLI